MDPRQAQRETTSGAGATNKAGPAMSSGPMSEQVATWYVTFTDGTLHMVELPDGWYLYDRAYTRPVQAQ